MLSLTALPWGATEAAGDSTALGAAVTATNGVNGDVLDLALGAVRCAVNSGDIEAPRTLTLIDYSKPSTEPRLWVFDIVI